MQATRRYLSLRHALLCAVDKVLPDETSFAILEEYSIKIANLDTKPLNFWRWRLTFSFTMQRGLFTVNCLFRQSHTCVRRAGHVFGANRARISQYLENVLQFEMG